MRYVRPIVLAVVAVGAFLLAPGGDSGATPGAGGPLVFSVRGIGAAHDITNNINAFGPPGATCAAADILTKPGKGAAGACAVRPGPVPIPANATRPDAMGRASVDLGLDLPPPPGAANLFQDDLNALSYSEVIGVASDFDFSVDAAPADGGMTVGTNCGPAPNVNSEATAVNPEAQGDIFTTAGAPANCNTQNIDEATLNLLTPGPLGQPAGGPPLDDIDALAEFLAPPPAGGCTYAVGTIATAYCAAFSLEFNSAILAAPSPIAPSVVSPLPPDAGSILVPPGAPANAPAMPVVCLAGAPCVAVHSTDLGLLPGLGALAAGDDIDALCWFDADGDNSPDLPNSISQAFGFGPGDYYLFSLSPFSTSVINPPNFSAADLLTAPVMPGAQPVVVRTAASLGLLATDNVDGLICHDSDTDGDFAPDLLDNCPAIANANQSDLDFDMVGDVCDNCPNDSNPGQENNVHPGTPAGDHCDDPDSDTVMDIDDNCPDTANPGQENFDGDAMGDACDPDNDNDGVPNSAEGQCRNPRDDDNDGRINDGCPKVGLVSEANIGGCAPGDATNDDPQDDNFINDGCPGFTETNACGSSDLDAANIPERIDGAFAGVDDDGDTEVDEELPRPGSDAFDCDQDGFTGSVEMTIFSAADTQDDQAACADTTDDNDEANDRWPPDFDDNQTIDIVDVLAIKPVFGQPEAGNERYGLYVGLGNGPNIDIVDVLAIKPFFGESCAPVG